MREVIETIGIALIIICTLVGAVTLITLFLTSVGAFTPEEVVEELSPPVVEFKILLVGNKYNRRTRVVELGVVTLPATMFVEEEYLGVLMEGSTWGIMTPREEKQ